MKKGEKKKRQKALKKRTQRKQSRRRWGTPELHHLRQARTYPIEDCWTQPDWREGGLAVVVVARRQPDGNLIFGVYLVDYYCLGLKDTFYDTDVPADRFYGTYLSRILPTEPPLPISPALAHEIIYGGIDYAAQFGFRPHSEFKRSCQILDPPDRQPPTGEVEFGHEGKPLYVEGPRDNAEAILRQLARTAGEGNFDFVVLMSDPPPSWEEEWE